MSTNLPDPPERREAARSRGRRADVLDLLDALQRQAPERPKLLVNTIGMKLVLIPAGVFGMGSPDDEPGPARQRGAASCDAAVTGVACSTSAPAP